MGVFNVFLGNWRFFSSFGEFVVSVLCCYLFGGLYVLGVCSREPSLDLGRGGRGQLAFLSEEFWSLKLLLRVLVCGILMIL